MRSPSLLSSAEALPAALPHRLRARIVRVADLGEADTARMFALMRMYYDAVTEEGFRADLARKDAVILLCDDGAVQGFSTLVTLAQTIGGRRVRAVFSGDTVLEKAYWGQRALGRAFLGYLLRQKLRRPFTPLYWLLIAKGYKTYLLMANNFAEHYPRYERATPPDRKALADAFYQTLFPGEYDPGTGRIRFAATSCRLKSGVAEIADEWLGSHPRIAFFQQANPAWREGVELACLARMTFAMPLKYAWKALRG